MSQLVRRFHPPSPTLRRRWNFDLIFDIFRRVEDTFILLDALETDAERLRALNPRVAVEIGKQILLLGLVARL